MVVARPIETIAAYVDERATAGARRTYGAPFVASTRRFAYAALDGADGPQTGALVMTVSGGVATVETLEFEPQQQPDAVGPALLAQFESSASYNNCHKAFACVKRGGDAEALLLAAGYRIAASLERHFFQQDFVELVKWLA